MDRIGDSIDKLKNWFLPNRKTKNETVPIEEHYKLTVEYMRGDFQKLFPNEKDMEESWQVFPDKPGIIYTQKKTGFDLETSLNSQEKPIIEIGGPSPVGIPMLEGINLQKKIITTNIVAKNLFRLDELALQLGTDDFSQHKLTPDIQTNGTKLAFGSNSIGACIIEGMNFDVASMIIKDVARVLAPGGILAMEVGMLPEMIKNTRSAQKAGLTLVQYTEGNKNYFVAMKDYSLESSV